MSEINAGAAIEAVAFDFEYTSYIKNQSIHRHQKPHFSEKKFNPFYPPKFNITILNQLRFISQRGTLPFTRKR